MGSSVDSTKNARDINNCASGGWEAPKGSNRLALALRQRERGKFVLVVADSIVSRA
jgi:hypothetical protein